MKELAGPSGGVDVEQLELAYPTGGSVREYWYRFWENRLTVSIKAKHMYTLSPNINTHGFMSDSSEFLYPPKDSCKNITAKNRRQPKCLSTIEFINRL